MSPIDVLRTALGSLRSNKLRSVLTLLGIIIGITAVTVLMTIGRGVQRGITAQIESQGTNLLFVSATFGGGFDGPPPPEGVPASFSYSRMVSSRPLTLEDAYALVDPVLAPSVKASVPYKSIGARIVPAGGAHPSGWADAQAAGVTPEYAQMRNVQMEQGEFINNVHLRNSALVAVIDKSMAERMFTTRNPVGQPVRINGRLFTIIGVIESAGISYFGGGGGAVFVPITTALNRMAEPSPFRDQSAIDTIYAEAVSPDAVDDAKEEIRVILRLRHRLTGRDDFDIETLQELIESLNQIIAVFVLFLGTVAGISLLVGGIGVMNIMLVSVTERTREIGIRKAMGAKRRDVLFQFVTEAILLTMGGGAIGLLLSLALTPPINLLVGFIVTEGDPSSATAPPGVGFDPGIATVALLVSATIGLCAGIYPAMRASRMHPIEALRYE